MEFLRRGRAGRARGAAMAISVCVHGALLTAACLSPMSSDRADTSPVEVMVMDTELLETALPSLEESPGNNENAGDSTAEVVAPPPHRLRGGERPRAEALLSKALSKQQPQPAEQATADEPTASLPSASPIRTNDVSPDNESEAAIGSQSVTGDSAVNGGGESSGTAGRPSGGVTDGDGSGAKVGTPATRLLTPSERQDLIARYLKEMFRTRIAQHFSYPPQARTLEIEGTVRVKVVIDGRGQVRDLQLEGPCPHELLCADALRTLRAAQPFPPPPRLLGDQLRVDVPLTYALESG